MSYTQIPLLYSIFFKMNYTNFTLFNIKYISQTYKTYILAIDIRQ
jgi:hypothetical protein